MKTDYEFTSFTTKKVMNILLTMERDVCDSLRKCEDIKAGMFKIGTYMGGARSDIFALLKAEEDKSYDAQLAREAETTIIEADKVEPLTNGDWHYWHYGSEPMQNISYSDRTTIIGANRSEE